MKTATLLVALGLQAAAPAGAACAWEWLCNGEGRCKHMPVCDTVNETPPPRPEAEQPPAVPPLAMRPHRIAGAGVSPRSNLTCEFIMRKGKSGRWQWHEACFCADPERSRDATAPFANIVRCDTR